MVKYYKVYVLKKYISLYFFLQIISVSDLLFYWKWGRFRMELKWINFVACGSGRNSETDTANMDPWDNSRFLQYSQYSQDQKENSFTPKNVSKRGDCEGTMRYAHYALMKPRTHRASTWCCATFPQVLKAITKPHIDWYLLRILPLFWNFITS